MRCQEPTSAWRRLLIEGVSRRDEKNDSKSNHASLLMTCVLLDTPFPLCFLSGDFSAYILLACYFKRYFHWCPACVWAEPAQFYPKKFYGQLISCKIQVQSFTLHIQSFTPGFLFDYLMNQHPMTPVLWFLGDSMNTVFFLTLKRIQRSVCLCYALTIS